MFESIVSFLLAEHLAGASFEPPLGPVGYNRITHPDRRPYRTADGWIGVLPYDGRHWRQILELIGRHDLVDADWVQDPVRRADRIGELYGVLADGLGSRTTAEWVEAIGGIDVPCAPVATLHDVLTDDHLAAVGMFPVVEHPTEGRLRQVRSPFRDRDGRTAEPDLPAPGVGEHTAEVLDALDP